MAKLKHIVRQLSRQDYESIHNQLVVSGAGKSAYLLEALRTNQVGDYKIVSQLGVNTNAYYTLRSRLGHKIEQYLLEQISSPRTTLLRKVANLHEIVFGNLRAIAVATLKSLEKELQEYDLSAELMLVCKYLKRLHANSPLEYEYSKRYNKHMACMIAVDKSEHLLLDYIKCYSKYYLEGNAEDLEALGVVKSNIQELAGMFSSHRLHVYEALLLMFDHLFVTPHTRQQEPIENTFERTQRIFELYNEDPLYPHFNILLDFLRYAYCCQHKIEGKAEALYEQVLYACPQLLDKYNTYTFPPQALSLIISQAVKQNRAQELQTINEELFAKYDPNPNDVANYVWL